MLVIVIGTTKLERWELIQSFLRLPGAISFWLLGLLSRSMARLGVWARRIDGAESDGEDAPRAAYAAGIAAATF